MKTAVESPKQPGRRTFLSRIIGVWSMLTAVPAGAVLLEFVTPPRGRETARESIRVAGPDDIPFNTARIFKFNKEPVVVVHTNSGQFKAFSARCTHLGCVVQYDSGNPPHFSCNCHGSRFDANGRNIAGPAPSPLKPFRVTLEGPNLVVSRV
jgi:Rieske Fe-S protein